MKTIAYKLFLVGAIALMISCSSRQDRSAELNTIETLLTELEQVPERLESADIRSIQETVNTIKGDLKELQNGYHGTMATKDAFNMDKYKDISKVYKRYDFAKMDRELKLSTKQLENLKELINSEATQDKAGNVIDDNYITKAFNTEKTYAEGLIKASHEIGEKKTSFYERFNKMKPYVDSLLMEMPTE